MSNYYTTSQDMPASIHVDEKKSARKIEKGLKRLLIIAAVILVAQIIWLLGISPFIPFSVIEVHGIEGLNRSQILSLGGINDTSSFFSTNTNELQRILSAHVLVDTAVVMRRFPDRLSIFLTPREAAAVTLANTDSGQKLLFIDRHGVFFKTGEVSSMVNFPVISGIENPRLNTRLPDSLVSLTASLDQLARNAPELLSAVSEIRIERKVWDGFELVLFPVHSSIRVRIENNLTEEILRYMLLMLNVFDANIQKPNEIDFRSGMGSYTVSRG